MNLKNRVAELEARVRELEGEEEPDALDEFKKLADEFILKHPRPPHIPDIPVPYSDCPPYPPYHPGPYSPRLIIYRIYTTWRGTVKLMKRNICQIPIFVLSAIAGLLVAQADDELRKWGYIVGLASEPFWFWASIEARQWGVFGGCVVWTVIWILGCWNHWI